MGSHAACAGITINKFEDFMDITPCHCIDTFFCHLFNNPYPVSDYIMSAVELAENDALETTKKQAAVV
jgi:hypothetical protein